MIKKLISFLFISLSTFGMVYASDLQASLTSGVQEVIPQVNAVNSNISYTNIGKEIQFWIFAFIGIIAVVYIIFIGAKLLWAPGSTEEMSKALKSLGYVVVGLALIPFAYFLIKFIINIRI